MHEGGNVTTEVTIAGQVLVATDSGSPLDKLVDLIDLVLVDFVLIVQFVVQFVQEGEHDIVIRVTFAILLSSSVEVQDVVCPDLASPSRSCHMIDWVALLVCCNLFLVAGIFANCDTHHGRLLLRV